MKFENKINFICEDPHYRSFVLGFESLSGVSPFRQSVCCHLRIGRNWKHFQFSHENLSTKFPIIIIITNSIRRDLWDQNLDGDPNIDDCIFMFDCWAAESFKCLLVCPVFCSFCYPLFFTKLFLFSINSRSLSLESYHYKD